MKKWTFLLFFSICSCSQRNESKDLISFHRGYTFWENITTKQAEFPYDVEEVIKGIRAASLKKDLPVKEETLANLLDQSEQAQAAKNLTDAEAMLKEVSNDSIEVVPNKLYYKVLHLGGGTSPLTSNGVADFTYRVSILEKGTLHEILSTHDTPIQVSLEDTIPGFSMGIIGMTIGEKRVIYMHPDLTAGSYPEFLNKLLVIEVSRQ